MQGSAGGFPFYWLRLFGLTHLMAGVVQLVLSFTQLGLSERDKDTLWTNPAISRYRLYILYPAFAVLFVGIMMATTGFLAIGALITYDEHRQTSMISGFKLMNIMVSVLFGPLSFGIGLTYAHLFDVDEAVGAVGLVICVFAGIQTLIAMIGSCMTCCYSPYSDFGRNFGGPRYGDRGLGRMGGGLGGGLGVGLGGGLGYGLEGRAPSIGGDSLDFRGRLYGRRF